MNAPSTVGPTDVSPSTVGPSTVGSSPRPQQASAEAPIPMSRLIRVEWGKATDTRSARWLIGLAGLATAALMLLPLLRTGSIDQSWRSYLFFATTGVTILLPVVAIMTLTTEWTQRTVLATFTQVPRRERVITAKIAVSMLMGLAAIVFAVLVAAVAVGITLMAGRHVTGDLGAAAALGLVLYVLLQMLWGVAFGALLHNTAASIVLFFLAPTVVGIVGASVSFVSRWFDPSTTFDWVRAGEWSGHVAPIVASTAIWVLIPLAIGLVRTARREIK